MVSIQKWSNFGWRGAGAILGHLHLVNLGNMLKNVKPIFELPLNPQINVWFLKLLRDTIKTANTFWTNVPTTNLFFLDKGSD